VIEVVRSTLGNGNGQPAIAGASPVQAGSPSPAARSPNPAAAIASEADSDSDAEFQADLRKSFIHGLPALLASLRVQLQALIKADNDAARLNLIQEIYRRIHALTGNAGLSGLALIAHMADALEALLKELHEKPKNMNASTLRTVAIAIDFLGILFEHGLAPEKQELRAANILVVDDEAISRRAVTYALEKAKLKSVSVEDPTVAYNLLTETKFDLVFLDVDMPGMNGFELCTKLRALPLHKKTPVVFVTSLTDFESRANSTMSGGNDFIAKPFLFIELAVKALLYVLRGRVVPQNSPNFLKTLPVRH
jgi:CheY-like chemotaxis protein/HPt (histidine-containing phosphotransfer) domain-containing protein